MPGAVDNVTPLPLPEGTTTPTNIVLLPSPSILNTIEQTTESLNTHLSPNIKDDTMLHAFFKSKSNRNSGIFSNRNSGLFSPVNVDSKSPSKTSSPHAQRGTFDSVTPIESPTGDVTVLAARNYMSESGALNLNHFKSPPDPNKIDSSFQILAASPGGSKLTSPHGVQGPNLKKSTANSRKSIVRSVCVFFFTSASIVLVACGPLPFAVKGY